MAKKNTKNTASNKSDDNVKGKPWTFPKHTLEAAIEIPKAIDEKNAGNPMRAADLCAATGFSSLDWRFTQLLTSANQYGLVTGTGAKATVQIEPLGQQIISPSTAAERKEAL